jgi:hypothetical protein
MLKRFLRCFFQVKKVAQMRIFLAKESVKITQLKALYTRDILTHNIAIKRYCDKNIFLRHGSL